MKRSRSGCHTCRARRIKCDETRPTCQNCDRRGVECNFQIKYQWIAVDDFDPPGTSPTVVRNSIQFTNAPSKQTPSAGIGMPDHPYAQRKRKPRLGPTSNKRRIGQSVVGVAILRSAAANELNTVMEEVAFVPEDEPVTVLNGPGSLRQFKKFCIRRRDASAFENEFANSNADDRMLMHSPLHRPVVFSDPPDLLSLGPAPPKPETVPPTAIFAVDISPRSPHIHGVETLSGLTDRDFFEHFVEVTADALVPIPYEENPFLSLLPKIAMADRLVWDLLVAYGASHKAMLLHGLNADPVDDTIIEQLVSRCTARLSRMRKEGIRDGWSLLLSTVLAMIEVDRGNEPAWRYFMGIALDIIQSRLNFSNWELDSEINSMTFRLVGYMCGIGNLSLNSADLLDFPSWPQWSGNLDYLTGIDLNLLPLFGEAAELIMETQQYEHKWTMSQRGAVYRRALRVMQRMNDYWMDEYWPDSEITAMCIMFQESLQVHVLRRVLKYPTTHPIVQRVVHLAMRHLERWIPPASTIQRCMTFSLVTIASESLVAEHRASLLIRLRHMAEAGFAYNWKVCDDIRRHWDANTSLIASSSATLII